MRPPSTWSGERLALLEKLWASGLSASQVGSQLGTTRNAVLGAVQRNGFSVLRPPKNVMVRDATRRKPPRSAAIRPRRHPAPPPLVCEPLSAEAPSPVEPRHLSLIELTAETCRWPYGDGPFTFCGHPPAADKPYCAAHWSIGNTGRPGNAA